MKKFLLLILICFAQITFSQTTKEVGKTNVDDVSGKNVVYNTQGVDVKPEFPGGVAVFNSFLDKNFIKPADKPKMKGKIYFTFIIEKDGSLSDIKILRDLGYGTGDEALRVIKLAPKWNPGKHKNKEVRTLNAGLITVS
jgi:protein TonB